MKENRYKKLFGWFAAISLLFATSCKDDDVFGNGQADEIKVTFSLAPENIAAVTRSGHVTYPDSDKGEKPHISDGSKADMLIYAVYDENGNLLEAFQGGSDVDGFTPGKGQTIKKIDQFPTTVNLTLKRGATYYVAFWAQSSQTKIYDTQDLKKVEVIYNELNDEINDEESEENMAKTLNNDELRDAFCRSVKIKTDEKGSISQNVYLYRPLAQINIGTSGFDYEIATRNSAKPYLYSKIQIDRAARYLDVVSDKIYSSTIEESGEATTEAFAVVDYEYAPIPAYINYINEEGKLDIEDPSYTCWDEGKENYYPYEEFLKVHLYPSDIEGKDKDEYTDYNSSTGYRDYANYDDHYNKKSETFKYLSMCYVLTNSTKETNAVLNNVKVWLATDASGEGEIQILNIYNVPVQRNWRTNILGNLLTEEVPLEIKLDKDFAGEFNGWNDGTAWVFSGPLARGVYFDAEADEIQISTAEGLLWFQHMVNGSLKVRETHTKGTKPAQPGDDYYDYNPKEVGDKRYSNYEYDQIYYGQNDQGVRETYDDYFKRIKDDEVLRERILRATHTEIWPKYNNFHFNGATVKLMADIDLSGLDWIPIGFDGRIAETVQNTFVETKEENRGFYGIFDGNNHTISHMKTKRFGSEVPENFRQTLGTGPYDNPQWFGRGLFGQLGANAEIKNVRLRDVDVAGCQCVGAIAGAALGKNIKITNCIVDGGSLKVTPMYRGDGYSEGVGRTFARGVYIGGIVGYFYAIDGSVTDCTVQNLTITGYRRIGGLVGSIGQSELGDGNTETLPDELDPISPANVTISGNKLIQTTILASRFTTFGLVTYRTHATKENNWKYFLGTAKIIPLGFNWDASIYNPYAHTFVGGYVTDEFLDNMESNVVFGELTADLGSDKKRVSTIPSLDLKLMPMLSAWFTDQISLGDHYYGEPSAYTRINLSEPFNIFSWESIVTGYSGNTFTSSTGVIKDTGLGGNAFKFPIKGIPAESEISWDTNSHRAGLYVGSVTIEGGNGDSNNNRTVITSTNVNRAGDCTLFICPENRHQFNNGSALYKIPTVINRVVVRGSPYAYTGILFAPNKNVNEICLNNVTIYDVYRTIATDNWSTQVDQSIWPNHPDGSNDYDAGKNQGNVTLKLTDCNLRGYTVPGSEWQKIEYTNTVFERGASTGHGESEYTCKVESATDGTSFKSCTFKAPYIIDLTEAGTVTFDDCKATANSQSVPIVSKEGCTRIVILTDDTNNSLNVVYYKGENVME